MALYKKINGKLVKVNMLDKQLEIGISVELEHTDNKEDARKIAEDHLAEDENYYTKLKEAGL